MLRTRPLIAAAFAAALVVTLAMPRSAIAEPAEYPYEGVVQIDTPHDFDTLWDRLEAAVGDNEMGLLYQASASRGAAGRGVDIAGNAVFGVYRNDFAVRMLAASIPAGIQAPLIFYLTEQPDGTSRLTYRLPTAVFAPYGSADLDAMAAELDTIFAAIAADATAAN